MKSKNPINAIFQIILVVLLIAGVSSANDLMSPAHDTDTCLASISSQSSISPSATAISPVSGSQDSASTSAPDSSDIGQESAISLDSGNEETLSHSTTLPTSHEPAGENLPEESSDDGGENRLSIEGIRRESDEEIRIKQYLQNKEYIKRRLKISKDRWLKRDTVDRLIMKKKENIECFQKLAKLTRALITRETDRDLFAGEVADMDDSFVDKFFTNVQTKHKIDVKKQVGDYLGMIRKKEKADVRIREEQIESLFRNELGMDRLIDEIWESLTQSGKRS